MAIFDKKRLIGWLFPGPETSSGGRPKAVFETPPVKRPVLMTSRQAENAYPKKRRYPRYSVDGRDIRACTLSVEKVEILNLSVGGACIIITSEPRVGCSYLLELPALSGNLSLMSSVVWKRGEPADDGLLRHVTGMRFVTLSTGDIVGIKDFMRRWGIPDDRPIGTQYGPSPLRYWITSNESVFLRSPEMYEVKKISAGGMLVGSAGPMKPESRHHMMVRLSAEAEEIRVTGRIASVIGVSNRKQPYDIGIEFLNIEADGRKKLDRFIRLL